MKLIAVLLLLLAACKLETAVTDDTVRAELVSKGHEQTERFSVARSATGMAALYRRLAAEGTAS